ncbi:thiol reductase thioredoxin [Pueribacillus theae]|uniref:Thiol reductase thioredoxin n=1 Tax=Pueribacillus theae TaxID=2171751 RepID=A0A2U1K3A5_9BACI|nr:thioredoxin family protein [Pueribacillus theae]PWA12017.1 thiol reductase thioredoxin [Pueribacillus theae]
MISELNETQFKTKLQEEPLVAAFFHTPFCGTCKLARNMLETVISKMNVTFPIVSCDLNRMPDLAEPFKIMSVPILVFFKNGEPVERFVAFGELEKLFYLLTKFSE